MLDDPLVYVMMSNIYGVSQVMVHIADAPCHGSQYHNGVGDRYKSGDPDGISHDEMMQQVVDHDIQYWFGFIDAGTTNKMISVFNESLQQLSNRRLIIRQIEAREPKVMGDAVNR